MLSRREEQRDPFLIRVRARDFDAFYRQDADTVFRALAVTLGEVDLAQEAAAEAMARAYQHWPTVQSYDNPAGWAYRVGLNWATSRLRRRKRELARRPAHPDSEPGAFDPDLTRALLALDLPQRSVVVLRYLLDMEQSEIAALLGIPLGTVKSRLGRGLARLREAIGS